MVPTGGSCTWTGGLVLACTAFIPATGIGLTIAYC
jgi:hypothetical protein